MHKKVKSEVKWERRKKPAQNVPEVKPSDLPVDFLKLIESTVSTALEAGLTEVKKTHPEAHFYSRGAIFADEIMLTLTLSYGPKVLSATTGYASADFNPLEEKPTVDAVLAACLDAIGSVFEFYLDPKSPEKIAQLAHHSLSALEDGPFEWTPIEITDEVKIPVYVRIDKANPMLDEITEKWLIENDPEYHNLNLEVDSTVEVESEEFLEERIEAIRAAKSGSGTTGGSGPITH